MIMSILKRVHILSALAVCLIPSNISHEVIGICSFFIRHLSILLNSLVSVCVRKPQKSGVLLKSDFFPARCCCCCRYHCIALSTSGMTKGRDVSIAEKLISRKSHTVSCTMDQLISCILPVTSILRVMLDVTVTRPKVKGKMKRAFLFQES